MTGKTTRQEWQAEITGSEGEGRKDKMKIRTVGKKRYGENEDEIAAWGKRKTRE